MTLELIAVGGYSEVGKNMTAIKYNDEVIICDMGFFMPKLISFEEEGGDRKNLTELGLIRVGAVPNDKVIDSWKDKVKAIVTTHCHLDHIGAMPFLGPKYKCPIIGTPFTIEVLRKELHDLKFKTPNKLIVLNAGSILKVSKNIEIEFINTTHSTPQTVFIAIHTPDGTIIYANDFKLDNDPVLGKKPDYARLKKIASEKEVLVLIVDALYAEREGKTPSEGVAKQMLKDVLLGTHNEGQAIIASSFSSQIARIKSMIEFGKKLNRKIFLLGRSLGKYTSAAEKINLVNFTKDAELATYSRQIEKKLKTIEKQGRDKYMIICTGNQAEPGSVLSRLSTGRLKFKFLPGDHVVFSCSTIPVKPNIENRAKLEQRLRQKKARLFFNIHSSGHASREDLADLISIIRPKILIPSHGGHDKCKHLLSLGKNLGYTIGKTVIMLRDGKKINLK